MTETIRQTEISWDVPIIKSATVAGPFLKWAGGKGQLLTQLARFFPTSFGRYYEPFLGGGSVFFCLQPSQAVLSDINPNLVAAYRHIQTRLDDLLAVLGNLRHKYHSLSDGEQEKFYYEARTRYNRLEAETLDKTALLIFLNKTGYNGLYRENKSGGYNVPFGRYDNPAMYDEENLRAVAQTLQTAEILHTDFNTAVKSAQAGDFVYFDPPYMPISKTSSFTSYTGNDFGPAQQAELAATVKRLAERGVAVMVSNSDCDYIRQLYQGLNIHEVQASRAINSKATARGAITELVITSY